MLPRKRGIGVVAVVLLVVLAGCAGGGSDGGVTTGGATNAGTSATDGAPTTSIPSVTSSETSPTDAVATTTDAKPATSNTPGKDHAPGSNQLTISDDATWVPTSSRSSDTPREYITLRRHSRISDPHPLDLSGYTVSYGGGSTYTIPATVNFSVASEGDVYIWTGDGTDRSYGDWANGVRTRHILHANHDVPSIAREGTTVTLRNRSGGIVARNTVSPVDGAVPFVPTVNASEFVNGSVDTVEKAKNATPFALRAPTNLPQGYEFRGLSIESEIGRHSYVLVYSREPNDFFDDLRVIVTAPQAVNGSDRPSGSHPVEVGNLTGHYATNAENTGNTTQGVLQFVGSDGWGYYLQGPSGERRLVQTGRSIEVVEGNATE